jgi:hypothetical protein
MHKVGGISGGFPCVPKKKKNCVKVNENIDMGTFWSHITRSANRGMFSKDHLVISCV